MTESSAGWSLADVKAKLAGVGIGLNPGAELFAFAPPSQGDHVNVITLDRADTDQHIPYRVAGFAGCVRCHEICLLGVESAKVVMDPENGVYPLCMPCARETVPPGQLSDMHVNDPAEEDA